MNVTGGQAFATLDRLLDEATRGSRYLSQPEIAQLVVEGLYFGMTVLRHYELHAYVVMSNHVHMLVTPRVEMCKLMHSLKTATARRANRVLRRTGEPFWQDEYYDHWVRDGMEFERIRRYIERNPVRSGLAGSVEQYRWSSASQQLAGRSTQSAGQGAGSRPGGLPHFRILE